MKKITKKISLLLFACLLIFSMSWFDYACFSPDEGIQVRSLEGFEKIEELY